MRKAGLAVVAAWEAENGEFTEGELAEARIRVREEMRTARTVQRRAAESPSSESIKLSADAVPEVPTNEIGNRVRSLSEFKRNTREFLEQMRGSGHPVILTINCKAELVVQDALSYQKLLDRLEELESVAAVRRGLADVEAGRVTPLRQVEEEFRKKRGLPSHSR